MTRTEISFFILTFLALTMSLEGIEGFSVGIAKMIIGVLALFLSISAISLLINFYHKDN